MEISDHNDSCLYYIILEEKISCIEGKLRCREAAGRYLISRMEKLEIILKIVLVVKFF